MTNVKNTKPGKFFTLYGELAIVAGASEGLGAAFAEILAGEGFNLLLVARRKELLEEKKELLEKQFDINVDILDADLGDEKSLNSLVLKCRELNPGLLVYNAAFAPIGKFAEKELNDLVTAINVNVKAPLTMLHTVLPLFKKRTGKRSGVVLMSSLSGNQGSPSIATYGATKAFNTVFAQGLWYELKKERVDVTACVAGAIRTPGYMSAAKKNNKIKEAPGTLDAAQVARSALHALGKKPIVIPGIVNKFAYLLLGKLLPAKTAIKIMAASTKGLN